MVLQSSECSLTAMMTAQPQTTLKSSTEYPRREGRRVGRQARFLVNPAMRTKTSVICLLLALLSMPLQAQPDPLATIAEKTGFRQTGRYQDMTRLCRGFEKQWPQAVRVYDFGVSPQGRPMTAMVVSLSGTLQPAEAKAKGLPVVLVQGCIHAGEVCGKDAGFMALRELLRKNDPTLKSCVVVFVPIFNVDGHERFKAWNRPNQNGPQEMGWRVTAQNLNLNRDYTKADCPEMRAMLDLLDAWDPILYVDLHATDGAQFQSDVAVLVEPKFVGAGNLQTLGKALETELLSRLKKQQWMPLPFYPSLVDSDNPKSGFGNWAFPPRFSTGYWALRNRLTVLVETHSWKPYETRVKVTRDILCHLLDLTKTEGGHWMAEAAKADKESLAGQDVNLSYTHTKKETMIDFPGYAYKLEDSAISGAKALVYDPATPENWRVPFYAEVVPDKTVQAPTGGYIIPRALVDSLRPLLVHHHIQFHTIDQASAEMPVEVFRATGVEQSKSSFEGRQTTKLTGGWTEEHQPVLQGSLYVPIGQPEARLVMALLEPQAPDSLAFWGFFNACFEQKEYMENYVAEEQGKKMLERDPALAAEFQKRLAEDEAFRNSPEARLDFFYQRHPSWDTHRNLYPIFRTHS